MKKYSFIILLLIIGLSGCRQEKTIESIEFIGEESIEFQIGVDQYSDFGLIVHYEDDSFEELILDETLIQNSEVFDSVGIQIVEIQYKGFNSTHTIFIYETQVDLQLLGIYYMALQENAVVDSYEDWLESIRGEDGVGIEDAMINASGHLIIEYSNGTIEDLGLVVGGSVGIENTFLVLFFNDTGLIISAQIVIEGEDAIAPIPNITPGYTFVEWDEDFTNIQADKNIYPQITRNEYTVSFQCEDFLLSDVIVLGNEGYVPTYNIEVDGYDMQGWYYGDEEDADRFYENTKIYENLTLYCRLVPKEYQIIFYTDGEASFVPSVTYTHGEEVVAPSHPTHPDLFFGGWYYDYALTHPAELNDLPAENVTLYADWIDFDYSIINNVAYIRGSSLGHKQMIIPREIEGATQISINQSAFEGQDFQMLDLPDTLRHIKRYAFAYNESLKEVIVQSPVIEIEEYAFEHCTNLESAIFAEGITHIPQGLFMDTGLTNVVLPDSVIEIGTQAFYRSNLQSIEFPANLEKIASDAFNGTSLEEIALPDSVWYIGHKAFANIESLTSISIGEEVEYLSIMFLYNNPNLENVELDSGNKFYKIIDNVVYNTSESKLVYYAEYKIDEEYYVPVTIYDITGLESTNQYLKHIYIPLHIDVADDLQVFSALSALETFNETQSIYPAEFAVDEGILYSSDYSTLLRVPLNYQIEEPIINANTTSIRYFAFKEVKNVKILTIPNTIDTIGFGAFRDMPNLGSVTLSNAITTIPSSAFYNCDSLETILVPGNVTNIEYKAFAEMDVLSNLTFNEGLKVISSNIISNSNEITTLNIPASVDDIDLYAFTGAGGLADFSVSFANPNYNEGDDGIIYNSDWTELLFYVEGITDSTYYMGGSVEVVSANFGENPYLQDIYVSENISVWDGNARGLPNLRSFRLTTTNYNQNILMVGRLLPDPEENNYIIYVEAGIKDLLINDVNSYWFYYSDIIVELD